MALFAYIIFLTSAGKGIVEYHTHQMITIPDGPPISLVMKFHAVNLVNTPTMVERYTFYGTQDPTIVRVFISFN